MSFWTQKICRLKEDEGLGKQNVIHLEMRGISQLTHVFLQGDANLLILVESILWKRFWPAYLHKAIKKSKKDKSPVVASHVWPTCFHCRSMHSPNISNSHLFIQTIGLFGCSKWHCLLCNWCVYVACLNSLYLTNCWNVFDESIRIGDFQWVQRRPVLQQSQSFL